MGLRRKKSLTDQASDYVEAVKPQLESAVTSVKDKAKPLIADAREKATPVLNDAREKAAPALADARAKALPVLAEGAALAADKVALGATIAAEKAAQGRDLASAKAAEVKREKKRGGKLKKLLFITGLAAVGGFVYKKLRGDAASDNWQSSYTPTPAPATPPPPAPAASAAGTDEATDDPGGASPDEAIADAAESPHPVTTPDDPADVVSIEDESKKK